MCDTIYLKRNGKSYFGKNSDRSPNEAHLMIREPAKDFKKGEMLKATYIEIPQVEHTNACVLLKPHWIWGAEMGWNEFGLNIGNEAVFTNVKREKQNGLIGMDMLRLTLERCKTSSEAVDYIISLLEIYGQHGNCGFDKKFYYDNAFLIADNSEAYILETAGRNYVVKKVMDTATISNCLSIREDFDRCSPNFEGDFKEKYQNNLFTLVAGAEKRKKATFNVLVGEGEPFNLMKKALSCHSSNKVNVNKSSTDSVCMHAGNLFGDQTTGSYFGEINKCYFVTGSSFPCLSIYKPLTKDAEILPEDEETALKYWLKHEKLNRHIMSGNINIKEYSQNAELLQEEFINLALNAKSKVELERISKYCFEKENAFVESYLDKVKDKKIHVKGGLYFKNYWNKKTSVLSKEYKGL